MKKNLRKTENKKQMTKTTKTIEQQLNVTDTYVCKPMCVCVYIYM